MRYHNLLSMTFVSLPLLAITACNGTNDLCSDITCSGVGSCQVTGDKAICLCQEGYDADFDNNGKATCVPNWQTRLNCNANGGVATLEGNNAYCKCNTGYSGSHCDNCLPGYSANGGKCLPDGVDPSECTPNPCDNDPCVHGICRCNIVNNETTAVCLCDSGYTGDTCNQCADDYAADGLNCIFDNCKVKETFECSIDKDTGKWTQNGHECHEGDAPINKVSNKCDDTTCGNGGTCICDPATGVASCQCEFPYDGPSCNECLYGYEMKNGQCEKAPPCNQITFTYENKSASSVKIGGDWLGCTKWAECAINMTKNDAGIWEITLSDIPGGHHAYKFNINGQENNWAHDPNNPNLENDNMGGFNNFIEVCEVCNVTPDPCEQAPGTPDLCNNHGGCSCKMEGGTPITSCMCGEGYAGDHCEKCASGYAKNSAGRCVSSVCGNPEEFDWRDAVLYFVMTDRFYDSDHHANEVSGATNDRGAASAQYLGGDWKGVTEKMDYLADLGVTAIWLGAPYKNRDLTGAGTTQGDDAKYSSYHGYWPSPKNTDYGNMIKKDNNGKVIIGTDGGIIVDTNAVTNKPVVEDRLGSDQDLRDLISAAHGAQSANGQGIKVLFDYVMNHIDIESGLYKARPSSNWWATEYGRIKLCSENCDNGSCWDNDYWMKKCAFTDYLVPFDYDVAEPRTWSVNDALWWAKEYNIDGYRLDAIKHVPLVWLTDFRARFNSAYPDPVGGRFYLVGETYDWGNRDLIGKFINPATMLDGQFDFPTRQQICNAVLGDGWMSDLANWMQGNDTYYTKGALLSTFLGNHDMPRVIHAANREVGCTEGSFIRANEGGFNSWTSDRFKQPTDANPYRKLSVAFAAMLMNPGLPLIYYGDEIGLAGGGDPDNRRMMVWDESQINDYQKELRSIVKALANIRGQQKAIGRGKRTTLFSSTNIWVYRMGGCGDPEVPDIIVALNKSGSSENITIPSGSYIDLFAEAMGNDSNVTGGKITLPAFGIKVLKQK